ncbi:unnamed protein product, partial [Brachionus calyciflorus]
MSILNEQNIDDLEANSSQSSYDEEVNQINNNTNEEYLEYNSEITQNDENNYEDYENEEHNDENLSIHNESTNELLTDKPKPVKSNQKLKTAQMNNSLNPGDNAANTCPECGKQFSTSS